MRKLRMGMIGGAPGAFIGPVHRIAAELDGRIAVTAGVFSGDPRRSTEAGDAYGLAAGRAYPDLDAFIAGERTREDHVDFVSIVTPNHHHFTAAAALLRAGLPVVSDKPATATLAEARALAGILGAHPAPYAVTYTYTGYPLVREARARVADGALGVIRKVVVEYPQGWLAAPVEHSGNRQAAWRTDPALAGPGGCIGDIGVHAFNLAEFVCGLRVTALFADLGAIVPGRLLDDDATVLLRFENGARGVLMASQISLGAMNGLRLRVYGDQGALDWSQEEPNTLCVHRADGVTETLRTGGATLGPQARAATRLPAGHPEGYLEAFANLYGDFADWLVRGHRPDAVQGIETALRSMAFIETAVAASRAADGWVPFEP
jgi:predicted dehydrogenase